MNKDMYEILEICLNELESGALIYELLERYPEYAAELGPILEASLEAQSLAVRGPSAEVYQRNRVRVMRRLAQMREEKSRSFAWFLGIRRTVVTFALGLLIFMSGTNLVRAASDTIPGDGLYTVKRSWENVVLFFAVNPQTKDNIQIKFENERLDELDELFADSRSATVDFSGKISSQNGDGWWIANVLVIISPETVLPNGTVEVGSAVRVTGFTRGDGLVLANTIELLPANVPVPDVQGPEDPLGSGIIDTQSDVGVPAPAPTTTVPNVGLDVTTNPPGEDQDVTVVPTEITKPPVILEPKIENFDGVLKSIKGDLWKVNGVTINVADAVIQGVPSVGAQVSVKGYYQSNGIFVVMKIEITSSGYNQNGGDGNNGDNNWQDYQNNNNDNNHGDHYENRNYNSNDNQNYNSNDNHNSNENDNEH